MTAETFLKQSGKVRKGRITFSDAVMLLETFYIEKTRPKEPNALILNARYVYNAVLWHFTEEFGEVMHSYTHKSRKQEHVFMRYVIWKVYRHFYPHHSNGQIGGIVMKEPSSVIHGIRTFDNSNLEKYNVVLDRVLTEIQNDLEAGKIVKK